MALSGRPHLGNFSSRRDTPPDLYAQASALTSQLDPSLTWEDVRRFRNSWPGKLVLKGIMSVTDARKAADCGVDGIIVSNHGGRQLNGGQSSIMALPDIAREVGADIEIFLDGGIRRGSQVIKALALGADAVLIGRAYAYGLAALGRAGVSKALNLIATEMDLTLALMGMCSISDLRGNDGPAIVQRSCRSVSR
jgi:isopentenyl diphosphate isomerase/L-lactate dehydrogenase-like FMN-dependent dehydrogenase